MKVSVNRHSGLVGFYWCGATRDITLQLTTRFGFRLRLAKTERERNRETTLLLDMVHERARLMKLTNEELVAEALSADNTDLPVINEMMDRLDPGWYEEDRELRTA